jgi:hypothetical protein
MRQGLADWSLATYLFSVLSFETEGSLKIASGAKLLSKWYYDLADAAAADKI